MKKENHSNLLHSLSKNEVHLWFATFSEIQDSSLKIESLLSSDEKERSQKYLRIKDQVSFSLSRGFLRSVLSVYLELSPQEIQFQYSQAGKPNLSHHSKELFFNLSHSEGALLIAVSLIPQTGVDLEFIHHPVQWDLLAKKYFSESEIQFLMNENNLDAQKSFLKLWCLREAYLKAKGTGISEIDQSFTFEISSSEIKAYGMKANEWHFKELFYEEHVGALAVQQSKILTTHFTFTDYLNLNYF
ncbi:MAG: 4'-phosphopantetheinyl transferase superfamily protein [Deltaproteobacteria bacterium]|nr:4'-phosphopantetheinyl transferase superfamily protein [Deltaproteobacteria bacterium]